MEQMTASPDPHDVAAARSIIQDAEDGFNDNDWQRSVVHFATDAVVVTAMGEVWSGRAAITEADRESLSGFLKDAHAHYRVADVGAIGADVLVVNKDAWSTAAAAEAGRSPEMRALYVLARRGERWWIVRRQNTLVQAAGHHR